MMMVINSLDNQLVRHARAVRDGKVPGEIFIEGFRLAMEAARAALSIRHLLCTEKFARDERGARLFALPGVAALRTSFVSERVFASLSDTKTPQGVMILAARPEAGREALERSSTLTPLLVIMHQVNNPSNAGAILRTAEAAGATGGATTKGTTDLFSPRALRGAMGSSFRLPLWVNAGFAEILSWCRQRGVQTVGADVRAQQTHTEFDWTQPSALIVGAESLGLKSEEARALDARVRIPMRAPVESLNVSVASSIVLYEAARQREQQP
ncbi:MAG TPA: RNA methyltransferase [Pyrinomonadaceae bacterium]|jgi:TrmH family RNA methyltransferase